MKYICPICGRSYNDAMQMAECVNKCAVRESENQKSLTNLEKQIKDKYTELRDLVNEYNKLSGDKKQYKTSLSSTDSVKWKVESKDYPNLKSVKIDSPLSFENWLKDELKIDKEKKCSNCAGACNSKMNFNKNDWLDSFTSIYNALDDYLKEGK